MDYGIFDAEEFGSRGDSLVSFLKQPELRDKGFGQIYCALIKPGAIRANHYHMAKEEWLILPQGKLRLALLDMKSNERVEFVLDSADKPLKKVRIGPYVGHAVENISPSTAILIEYASKPFDAVHEDKHACEVLRR